MVTKNEKLLSSLAVVFIGLITPFLIWVLLFGMANSKAQSFDPNPLVLDLVKEPRQFSLDNPASRWFHLIGKDGVWSIKQKDGTLLPLEQLPTQGERLVLLLEAQGPTLAMNLFNFLKEHELTKKVILLSASDGLLKDLRFHDGQLTMSCGQAYIIRFNALRRLKLQGLMTIDMSAVLLDPKIAGPSLQELIDYFVSHNVAVFIPPNANLQGIVVEKKANLLLE